MEENTSLILLVPCYNPSSGWEVNFVHKVKAFQRSVTEDVIIVLINDGSTIDIQKGVDKIKSELGTIFHYIHQTSNKGKGAALKAGAALFNSDNYMFTDIDFPYTMVSMQDVYKELINRRGLVIGHRTASYYENVGKGRLKLSKILRSLNKLLMGLPTDDTQCGLKAFDQRSRNLLLECTTDRFLIDLELLLKANQHRVSIVPINVALRDDIAFTEFNSNVLAKELFNFIKLIMKYRVFRMPKKNA